MAVGKQHFVRARKNPSSPAQACESLGMAVGKQHFVRARKNSSLLAQACDSLGMTEKLLRSNNYPEAIVEEISQKS